MCIRDSANIGNKGRELSGNADYLNYTINDKVILYTLHDESLSYKPVSYTHLDVYKRQNQHS